MSMGVDETDARNAQTTPLTARRFVVGVTGFPEM